MKKRIFNIIISMLLILPITACGDKASLVLTDIEFSNNNVICENPKYTMIFFQNSKLDV